MDKNNQSCKTTRKRLVSREAEKIISEIDKLLCKDSVIVTIEGGSASGKTTLSSMLQEVYDCNVFHMDDFFLQAYQRTPERLAQVGGNVDRERFYSEVLQSLKSGETVSYRRFDCQTQTLGEPIIAPHKKLTVVEGAYSMHPAFSRYYDLAVFLDIDPAYQRKRILIRNSPNLATRFFNEWIPMENKYFSETKIKEKSDLILYINER